MALGVIYERMGEVQKAKETYKELLARDPDFAPALNNLAWLELEKGGNVDVALSLAQKAKERVPLDPAVSDTLGWAYFRKGLPRMALPLIQEALEKLPENPAVLYHLGAILHELGDGDKGQEFLERALKKGEEQDFPERDEAVRLLAEMKKKREETKR
jgi:tetratricopeptide (TPR) repeat protein